jgi:hypothetical protein
MLRTLHDEQRLSRFKLNESNQTLKGGRTSLEDELRRGRRKEDNVRQVQVVVPFEIPAEGLSLQ